MLRGFGAVLAVLALSILGASCVGLMDLDGYAGATEKLCETLDQCFGPDFYPSCREHNDPRLANAGEAERELWLTMFADTSCLETCESARACLDESPLCGDTRESCALFEQCCGFTTGDGECLDGACCKPDGIACSDASECCLGDCSMPAGESQTYCGGFVCKPAGDPCDDHFECCTAICINGQCSDQTCLPLGSECTLNAECCEGECVGGDVIAPGDQTDDSPPTGTCVEPACVYDGGPCDASTSCCNDYCVTSLAGESVCSFGECLPEGVKCEPGANECCSGSCDPESGYCVQTCGRPGDPCETDGACCDGHCDQSASSCACYEDGSECSDHTDCCDSNCNSGFCGDIVCPDVGTPCTPGDETCCAIAGMEACQLDTRPGGANGEFACCGNPACHHTVCVLGRPLSPVCYCTECQDGSTGVPPEQCIELVCQDQPECCCFGWTNECKTAAQDLCGAICPVGGVEVPPGSNMGGGG